MDDRHFSRWLLAAPRTSNHKDTRGGIAESHGASHHLWGEDIQQRRLFLKSAHAPRNSKACLTRGQQLLSKLVYACFEARTSVCSQLKSNELYDSVVTLLIHKVSFHRERGDSVGRQRRMKPLMPKWSKRWLLRSRWSRELGGQSGNSMSVTSLLSPEDNHCFQNCIWR